MRRFGHEGTHKYTLERLCFWAGLGVSWRLCYDFKFSEKIIWIKSVSVHLQRVYFFKWLTTVFFCFLLQIAGGQVDGWWNPTGDLCCKSHPAILLQSEILQMLQDKEKLELLLMEDSDTCTKRAALQSLQGLDVEALQLAVMGRCIICTITWSLFIHIH